MGSCTGISKHIRITAILLAVILLYTNRYAHISLSSRRYADTSNPGNFLAHLITIVKVQNVCGENQDFVSARATNPELTHCQYSAAYEYLTQYPSCFSSGSIMSEGLSNYALAVIKDSNHRITNVLPDGGDIHYMTESKMESDATFDHVFIRTDTELSGAGSSWKNSEYSHIILSPLVNSDKIVLKALHI